MPILTLAEMQEFIGFTGEDAARLGALHDSAASWIPAAVDGFYGRLLAQKQAQVVFTGGIPQQERLRQTLQDWMSDLFGGEYDDHYRQKRLRIGATHLAVNLPQRFMTLGMEVIRQEMVRFVGGVSHGGGSPAMESIHKLLAMDLTLMLETYQQSYSDRIREGERSAVEERLTRAEHLAEIGQLAASLAHEIKNPLAGISGAIQVIRDDLSSEDPRRAVMSEILGQIRRLDAAVKDLLLYARPTPPRPMPFALGDAVRAVLVILSEEPALRHVRVEFESRAPTAGIEADGGQVEQLLLNLLINAAHASKPGQQILVRVDTQQDHVLLTVRDEGQGMPEEVLRRAFEPFFTTKARGTGLGLAICRRIVETNGGRIDLESERGRGTTVTVRFPLCGCPASPKSNLKTESTEATAHVDSRPHRRG